MFLPEPLPEFATALGLGLLIGVVRERHRGDQPSAPVAAGLRTHALTGLAGAVSWWLGLPAFAVVLGLVGLFVAL